MSDFIVTGEEAKDFYVKQELYPPDWYQAHIVNIEVKDNNNKTGKVGYFHFEVKNGNDSKILKKILNLTNPNPQAETIARAEIGKIKNCAGVSTVLNMSNMDILRGRPIDIKLIIKDYVNKQGEVSQVNDICDYRPKSKPIQNPNPNTPGGFNAENWV